MTLDDSESEDENHLVGNRYNNDDSDTDSEIDFYNLPSVGTKRLVLRCPLQILIRFSWYKKADSDIKKQKICTRYHFDCNCKMILVENYFQFQESFLGNYF